VIHKQQTDRELIETMLLALIESQRQLKEMAELLERNTEYTIYGKLLTRASKQQTIKASAKVGKKLDEALDNILNHQFDTIHQLVLIRMFGIEKSIRNFCSEPFEAELSNLQLARILGLIMGRKPDKLRQLISRPDFCWVDRANEPPEENTRKDRNIYRENPEAVAAAEEKVMASLRAAGLNSEIMNKIYLRGRNPL
jgi:hypothetical protein